MSNIYKAISATEQVKTGAGILFALVVSSTSSGTITIYDSAVGSTGDALILATLTPAAGATIDFSDHGVWCTRGLYIVITGTLALTVVYS